MMVVENPNKPYFYINGHLFNVSVDSEATSEIKLVKTRMFVSKKSWGYNDIQWTNFTGETLDLTIYSREYDDVYTGEETQPDWGGITDFYKTKRTPHAVLKYWAQNFVPCVVKTNIQSFESGTYVIDEFGQSNPSNYFVETKLKLVQYEKPEEVTQTYWKSEETKTSTKNTDTSKLTASTKEITSLGQHSQKCTCTSTTKSTDCKATVEDDVKIIQKYLKEWGYFLLYSRLVGNVPITGKYCYYTTQAIKQFQLDRGLTITGNFDIETKNEFLKKVKE